MVELALCAPVVVLLALGAAAIAQIADARAGLDAATQAAAAVAARSADPSSAREAAQAQFDAVVAAYPLDGCTLRLDLGTFGRNGVVHAASSGSIDLAWASLLPFPAQVHLEASSAADLEPYRTRAPAP
ncbi:MAG TPA: TadE/TadG family type IV pilus assembly protein [Candidatus Baltobacterales bacterium]|nr:TadE/TadG family type IV pilus assembly protein [Candidatus Baltobacterales bacterium]